MLCPQPWPISGSASYSDRIAIVGPSGVPHSARAAVSRPPTPTSTSTPWARARSASAATERRSSKADLGMLRQVVRRRHELSAHLLDGCVERLEQVRRRSLSGRDLRVRHGGSPGGFGGELAKDEGVDGLGAL